MRTPIGSVRQVGAGLFAISERTLCLIAHSRTLLRDVGIISTLTHRELLQDLTTVQDTPSDYQLPIFQTPSLRSSSCDTMSPVDTTFPKSNPQLQTASSGEAHVHLTAMSASVEPIPSAPHVMNGHGIHSWPHMANASLLRLKLVDDPEQGQALPVSAAPSL
jgi:hypothetical protein